MPKRLPTANETLFAVSVLLVLACLGLAAGFNFGDGNPLCDFVDKEALWEAEGIQCPGWSPSQPTTLYQCSAVSSTSFDEWLNQTTYFGPQYCDPNSENADSLDSQSNSEENSTFGLPEVIPLEGTPESVFQNESFNEDSGLIEIFTNDIPEIINNECVSKSQLMIVFQFEQDVTGQYEVFVNGVQYEQTPVGGRPERLFFFGTAPLGGGKPIIRLKSLPDHNLVLEAADYSVKQCDFQSPNNNNPGGDGDYVPPPPGPGE